MSGEYTTAGKEKESGFLREWSLPQFRKRIGLEEDETKKKEEEEDVSETSEKEGVTEKEVDGADSK